MPVAQISALKPGGNFNFDKGISAAVVLTIFPAIGASVDFSISPVWPCCHICFGAAVAVGAEAGAVLEVAGIWAQPVTKIAPASAVSVVSLATFLMPRRNVLSFMVVM